PPLVSTTRAPDERESFEARCPGFPSDCLRFVGWVAPPRRKTRFRLLASSTGRDSDPQGSDGRFPSCSRYISSPFPRLCLAQRHLFRLLFRLFSGSISKALRRVAAPWRACVAHGVVLS